MISSARIGSLCGFVGFFGISVSSYGQVLAFPEAEGFGRFATGARTNIGSATVYHVTNLNDTGAGSFRDAVSGSNRFIVFDVGGIAKINSVVTFASNITIAGQTAPGGFQVYGNRVAFHNANNLVSRYWGARNAATNDNDAASLARGSNMMFDHMSITWGRDGTFDINPDSGYVIDNITIQNTIIAQGLQASNHSTGGLMTLGEDRNISIIKTLFADNKTRNPKARGNTEFINNVTYGWTEDAYIMGDTTNAIGRGNAINNYFIRGPLSSSHPFTNGTAEYQIYGSGNYYDSNQNGVLDGGIVNSYPGATVVATAHPFPTTTFLTAQNALTHVLANVGPSITRDVVDTTLINQVKSYGTLGGLINRETDVYPNYDTDTQYVSPRARLIDTDADGMPDNWETAKGYNPALNTDWKTLNGSYTRLEDYLNELGAYVSIKSATAAGTWTTPATWGGAVPSFSTTAIATGGITHASGNAFARQLTLDASSTVSGGTLDVFDTALIGASANGSLTISNGTVSAGRIVLGSTSRTGTLTLTNGTLQTGPIVSGGGTASFLWNGGTFKATGAINIAVPTTIGNPVTFNTNGFSGGFAGTLTGSAALTKIGAGALSLGGVNSAYSGPIALNAGGIALATTAANSSTGLITAANGTTLSVTTSGASTPLALASGATVTLSGGGLTYNGAITGPTGSKLMVNTTATGNFSLGGSLSGFNGTADFSTTTGNVRLGNTASATAIFDLGASTAGLRSTNGNTTLNLGSLAGGATTKLQGSTNDANNVTWSIGALNSNTTFSGTVTDGVFTTVGPTSITKVGTGTLTLANAASSYTGVTTISAGTLSVNSLGNGGAPSNIGQSSNAASNLVLNGGTLRYTGGSVTTDREFTLTNLGGTIDASGTAAMTFGSAADITTTGVGNRTLTLAGTNAAFNGFAPRIVDAASGITSLTKSGNGIWRLFHTNTYSGNTNVTGGALYLVGASALPSGTGKGDLSISAGATVDLYGTNQTANGLNGAGTVTTTQNTARTLTVGNGDANGNFTGLITQGGSQTLALTKIGSGTQILGGVNTYTGTTTVTGGVLRTTVGQKNNTPLVVNNNAILEIPANGTVNSVSKFKSVSVPTTVTGYAGKIELHDNDLVVDYTGGGSSYASVLTMVKSGITSLGGDGTGITSSEVNAQTIPGTTLAVVDNALAGGSITQTSNYTGVTAQSVIVKFTWIGDSNLDGVVDGTDYALTDSGFASAGSSWNVGDYDYSGTVDGTDYALIDTGFGSQTGALPEPTALGVIGLAAMAFGRRIRRKCA